jgi:hypothetical protein
MKLQLRLWPGGGRNWLIMPPILRPKKSGLAPIITTGFGEFITLRAVQCTSPLG